MKRILPAATLALALPAADGADAVVAAGPEARFMDSGLVYADGARIHLRGWNELPLR